MVTQDWGLVKQLFDNSPVAIDNALLKELRSKLLRIPEYDEFELHFLELESTNTVTKQKKLIKYILGKLYGHLAHGWLDANALTVEHVLPQSQAANPELKAVIGKLGNLILATENLNEKLGTLPYDHKMAILKAENDVNLKDGYLGTTPNWTADEIIARTKVLARIAYEIVWRV